MLFEDFDEERRFREIWEKIEIVRSVNYSLFTFGESQLPYILVLEPSKKGEMCSLSKGEIRITRPLIITPGNASPEFRNFFEEQGEEGIAAFLMARTAAFSNLRLENTSGPKKWISDSVEEIVGRLNQQFDRDEEDRVAIITAPANLAGVALLKYAAERVISSAPDNLQELRERGFLP